jgi:hypothetical protein
MAEEIIIALPDRITPVSEARGMMISNSILMLRERGLFERYAANTGNDRDALLSVTPSSWVPLALAEKHYLACDALELSKDQQVELGHAAGMRVRGTVLASIAKVARSLGVEAWSAFKQYPRFWGRLYVGGAVGVTRLGNKEARIDVAGFPLSRIAYVRHGFCGMNQAGFELFSDRVQIRELSSSEDTFSIRVNWAD